MMDDERIEDAARLLGNRSHTDVVTFRGTCATLMRGIGYAEEVIKRMEAAMLNVPASTTSTAALRALKSLGLPFEENRMGVLVKGRYADLTVLSYDPRRIDAGALRDLKCEMTIVGGKVVHSRL